MKPFIIETYQYDELSESTKKDVLANYELINFEELWEDKAVERSQKVGKVIGIDIDVEKTLSGNVFDPEQGSTYHATVDLFQMIGGLASEAYRTVDPDADLQFEPCPMAPRILALLRSGLIKAKVAVEPAADNMGIAVPISFDYAQKPGINYWRIQGALRDLDLWITAVCQELNRFLLNLLVTDAKYLVSREAIEKTLREIGLSFTIDGCRRIYLP